MDTIDFILSSRFFTLINPFVSFFLLSIKVERKKKNLFWKKTSQTHKKEDVFRSRSKVVKSKSKVEVESKDVVSVYENVGRRCRLLIPPPTMVTKGHPTRLTIKNLNTMNLLIITYCIIVRFFGNWVFFC